jgi:hypothetical protein
MIRQVVLAPTAFSTNPSKGPQAEALAEFLVDQFPRRLRRPQRERQLHLVVPEVGGALVCGIRE